MNIADNEQLCTCAAAIHQYKPHTVSYIVGPPLVHLTDAGSSAGMIQFCAAVAAAGVKQVSFLLSDMQAGGANLLSLHTMRDIYSALQHNSQLQLVQTDAYFMCDPHTFVQYLNQSPCQSLSLVGTRHKISYAADCSGRYDDPAFDEDQWFGQFVSAIAQCTNIQQLFVEQYRLDGDPP